MTRGAVVLAVPPELASTIPPRRVIHSKPGRWRCGKWVPPEELVFLIGVACCRGKPKRRHPGGPRAEWEVVRFFSDDDTDGRQRAARFYGSMDARQGRALVLLDVPGVVLVCASTGAVLHES